MDISDRKKKILRAIIDDYVETAEPVSSKSIAQNSGLGLSSATIRNEMADLEALGYLEQPHTSAGRIPSAMGYRMYVNELMKRHKLSIAETEEINEGLHNRIHQLDKALSDVGKITSKLTSYPVYALATAAAQITISRFDLIYIDQNSFIIVAMLSNNIVKNKLVKLITPISPEVLTKLSTVFNASFTGITDSEITAQLISSTERASGDVTGLVAVIAGFAIEALNSVKQSEAYFSGASHLLEHPEYQNPDKVKRLLSYLSEENGILKLPKPENNSDIAITIGPENLAEELKDSSVIVAKYNAGNDLQGIIGVVGPTRMDYSKVAARLSYIAKELSWLLSGTDMKLPPSITDGTENNNKDDF